MRTDIFRLHRLGRSSGTRINHFQTPQWAGLCEKGWYLGPRWFKRTWRRTTYRCSRFAFEKIEDHPFLMTFATGDESWVLYSNAHNKKSWCTPGQKAGTTPRPNQHLKKVMLCIWWNIKGVVHFGLLPEGQTSSADLCCQQLVRLRQAIQEKRPELANRRGGEVSPWQC